jgi:hypothetical protein
VFLGRKVRPGLDPEWTKDDQDKAVAFIREQAKVCSGCNTRRDLWVKHDPSDPPYLGQTDYCPGCEMQEQERRNIREGQEGYVRVYLVEKHLAVEPDEEPAGGPI